MTSETTFSIDTEDREELHFEIDNTLYSMHSFAQLTPTEGIKLSVISRRMTILAKKMTEEEDPKKLDVLGTQTSELQDQLIYMMTDVPDDVRAKLRLDQRNIILEHVAAMSKGANLICPMCEKINPGDAVFCNACGDKLQRLTMVAGATEAKTVVGEATAASES